METLRLIVGLGNPGSEYAGTRHNAGFMAVERFAERRKVAWKNEGKFRARVARTQFEGRRLVLCEPQTFMNSSGSAVQTLAAYYKVAAPELLVVVDDADLPLGTIRMRAEGSSGGHHGLESIEQQLGTRDFARVRLGIGREPGARREITGYVLGQFEKVELPLVRLVLDRACDQMERWVTAGAARAMNEFNGTINTPLVKES